MTIGQFLQVIRQRWLSVLALLLIGAGVGGAAAAVQSPQYRATSQVFVAVAGSGNVNDLSQGNNFSAARVKSYSALAVTPQVLGTAAKSLGLSGADADLTGTVSAQYAPDTVLISIDAVDTDPRRAADVANAVTDTLVTTVDEIERTDAGKDGLVRLSVVQVANPPSLPFAPRTSVAIALGLLGGLAAGVVQALVRSALDTRLRRTDELGALSRSSVLAEIPLDDGAANAPLTGSGPERDQYSVRAESFRQLRTHLLYTNLEGTSQSVVVTSTTPGEGKSSTALNLALVLARNGARVALVDADLRRPTIGTYLGLESRVGLSTVLTHQVELEDAMQDVGTLPLRVLTSGRVPPNPSELLGSPQMAELIRDLERDYDYVIVDAPPVLPVTDPAVLGAICSGVLMVASVDGRIRRTDFVEAERRIEQVGARILGIAVNRTVTAKSSKTYYNYEPAAPVSESPRRASRAKHPALEAPRRTRRPAGSTTRRTKNTSKETNR